MFRALALRQNDSLEGPKHETSAAMEFFLEVKIFQIVSKLRNLLWSHHKRDCDLPLGNATHLGLTPLKLSAWTQELLFRFSNFSSSNGYQIATKHGPPVN